MSLTTPQVSTTLAMWQASSTHETELVNVAALSAGVSLGVAALAAILVLTSPCVRRRLKGTGVRRGADPRVENEAPASIHVVSGTCGDASLANISVRYVFGNESQASGIMSTVSDDGVASGIVLAPAVYSCDAQVFDTDNILSTHVAQIELQPCGVGDNAQLGLQSKRIQNNLPQRQSIETVYSFDSNHDSGVDSIPERDSLNISLRSLEMLFLRVAKLWDTWLAYKERPLPPLQEHPQASVNDTPSPVLPEQSLTEIDSILREQACHEWVMLLQSGSVHSSRNFAIGKFDEAGGDLRLANGSAVLSIPQGALDRTHLLYLGIAYEDSVGEETNFTPVYECGPSGLHFSKPLQLHTLHCASDEALPWLSPCVRESCGGSWQHCVLPDVRHLYQGHAVLSILHFTGFKLSAPQRRGNSRGDGMSKVIYVCYFNCHDSSRFYYLNKDDYLLERIREHEIRQHGSEVGMPRTQFVVHENCGSLLVNVQGTSSTTLEFKLTDIFQNAFGYAEVLGAGRVTSASVRQETGRLTCQFETENFSRDLQQQGGGAESVELRPSRRRRLQPAAQLVLAPAPSCHQPQADAAGRAARADPGSVGRQALLVPVERQQKDSGYISTGPRESAYAQADWTSPTAEHDENL